MILQATEDAIQKAAELLRAGEVVGMPTETVYGLAANALDLKAVAKIFEVKERPSFDPLIVHVASLEQAREVAEFNATVRALADAFWPGPLTMVLPKKSCVPDIVTSGLQTVGVRLPSHPVSQALIKASGLPLAAPSANLFGRVSPTSAQHVEDQLGERVSLTLDGGPCQLGLESTIIEVLDDEVRLLRFGNIFRDQLAELGIEVWKGEALHEKPKAPGMLKHHYAPKKPLRIVESFEGLARNSRQGLLAKSVAQAKELRGFGAVIALSQDGGVDAIGNKLYARLREMEKRDIDEMLIEAFSEIGLGQTIMDRLRRAASEL